MIKMVETETSKILNASSMIIIVNSWVHMPNTWIPNVFWDAQVDEGVLAQLDLDELGNIELHRYLKIPNLIGKVQIYMSASIVLRQNIWNDEYVRKWSSFTFEPMQLRMWTLGR